MGLGLGLGLELGFWLGFWLGSGFGFGLGLGLGLGFQRIERTEVEEPGPRFRRCHIEGAIDVARVHQTAVRAIAWVAEGG